MSLNRLAVLILAGAAMAQAQTRPAPGGPPPHAGGGLDAVKAQLRVNDEEWKKIAPALRQVVAARSSAEGTLVNGPPRGMRGGRAGSPGGMGDDSFDGPGGPRGPGGPPPQMNDDGPNDGPPRGRRGGPGGRGGPRGLGGPPPQMNDDGPNDGPPQGRRGGPGANRPGENRPRGEGEADGEAPRADAPRPGRPPRRNDRDEPNGPPPGFGIDPVAAAMNDLKTIATDPATTPDQLAAKLAAVRAERQKARTQLAAAVTELKAVVSPQQEAVLVALGFLE
ncbi:MAG TPA: hypothetical protein VF595_06840 [Tepidisphaeraceae bacterium]